VYSIKVVIKNPKNRRIDNLDILKQEDWAFKPSKSFHD
jgi:hypothetical protein